MMFNEKEKKFINEALSAKLEKDQCDSCNYDTCSTCRSRLKCYRGIIKKLDEKVPRMEIFLMENRVEINGTRLSGKLLNHLCELLAIEGE